ncbi:hypothetical protein [Sulfurimonas sp.]|uniref:hypothetical protein n=1 Tax=Sulfurimonas sp. TaxID=2022749 RepID=UPI002AB0B5FC|nr:hypothetical protein [Sulfurimonas sp.]
MSKILLFLFVSLLIVGCGANPSNTDEAKALNQKLPFRDASMMEDSTTKYKISIAVTGVSEEMQETYFSDELEPKGYVPLLVTITNNASQDVLVRSLETVIVVGNKTVKQSNADLLKKTIRNSVTTFPGINEPVAMVDNRQMMKTSAVNSIFFKQALREDIVHSGQSITGFVFFDKVKYPVEDKKLRIEFQTLRKLQYFNIDANLNYNVKK